MPPSHACQWAARLLGDLAHVMEIGGDVETCRGCVIEMFSGCYAEGQRVHALGTALPNEIEFNGLLADAVRLLKARPDAQAVLTLRAAFLAG